MIIEIESQKEQALKKALEDRTDSESERIKRFLNLPAANFSAAEYFCYRVYNSRDCDGKKEVVG